MVLSLLLAAGIRFRAFWESAGCAGGWYFPIEIVRNYKYILPKTEQGFLFFHITEVRLTRNVNFLNNSLFTFVMLWAFSLLNTFRLSMKKNTRYINFVTSIGDCATGNHRIALSVIICYRWLVLHWLLQSRACVLSFINSR